MKALKVLLVLLLITLLAAGSYLFYFSKVSKERVPYVFSLEGQDISGLKFANLKTVVSEKIDEKLAKTIPVSVETTSVSDYNESLSVSNFISYDEEANLAKIKQEAAKLNIFDRLLRDVFKQGAQVDSKLEAQLDEGKINAYVSELAGKLNREAKNKQLELGKGGLVSEAGQAGFTLDEEDTRAQFMRALGVNLDEELEGDPEIILHGSVTKPLVIESNLAKGKFIYVDLEQRMATLYSNGEVEKSYPVAIGKPGYSTPKGDFHITLKRRNPVWGNPGSAWAKNMPATMGPSANSPLGLRALNINSPGIRLHGTADINSIGKAASHGCVRLSNDNIVDLFDRVETGTRVYIR